jgi:ubiquinone/menaquinone biosynthesis C-methylase UbiE
VSFALLENLGKGPDRQRALANYRRLACGYDDTCTRIEALRLQAVRSLQLRPGETVFDIACGTGSMLPLLARAVGPTGQVVGVELSPEMAEQARRRAAALSGAADVRVDCCAVEDFRPNEQADALLLSYTHDVLQSHVAVERLLAAARPGARMVLLGMKTLPWAWGWPVNAFNLYRARRYLTSFRNLDRPWSVLERCGAQIAVVRTALYGSAYIATVTLPGRPPRAGRMDHSTDH